ncbi:MAG: hypothetical protein ACE5NW_04590 [Acidiferrobacterales bacterium]
MKALIASVAILSATLAMPVYAFQCPGDVQQIDAALQAGTSLSADQLAEVKKLRDEGERLHKAGKHGESVATLAKAKALLNI